MASICFVGLDNYPVLNPARGDAYFGGESVQQTLLARAYAAAGWDVHMVVKGHGQPQREQIDGITVHTAYDEARGIPVLRFLHPRLTGLLAALAAADADVYYQSCAGMQTGVTAWFARRRGRRFVFRIAHDTDCLPGRQLIRFWRDRKLYEYGLRRADFVAAQGEHQRALLARHYGLEAKTVPMAVELPAAPPAPAAARDIDVLWVNNLRDFKRPERMLELARRLPERLRIVMIGGPVPGCEALYRRIAGEADGLANLELVGAVPYAAVNDWFARSRVFVNTSESEGFPNSFLQAWVRGVPVVSFFDPDDLIARHGLGAAVDDVDAMAAAVRRLLGEPAELEACSSRARNFALAHHAPAAVVERYVTLGATPLPRRGGAVPVAQ